MHTVHAKHKKEVLFISVLQLKINFGQIVMLQRNQNANSIWCSQAVTHPSTNQTRRCLTSLIGREAVCSTWCGRWRESFAV